MRTIAVAGLSARAMAEAAARDGFKVLALDIFGDLDTRVAAARWTAIGDPATLRIDTARVLQALREARDGVGNELLGWVPGGGLEAHGELLAVGAPRLLGTAAADVARVRNPAVFFEFLAANDIEHPPVHLTSLPPMRHGWLLKDALGCGAWHIRAADSLAAEAQMPTGHYAQAVAPGVPMSATFIANGSDAVLLGCNRQIIGSSPRHPYLYGGVIGPVPLPDAALRCVQRALRALAAGFALRGICSLDFICDGSRVQVLEVNPRWPASAELYPHVHLMAAHVRACLRGELPPASGQTAPVRGNFIVGARRTLRVGEAAAHVLDTWPGAHDRPCPGQTFQPGNPLCSLGGAWPAGTAADDAQAALHQAREALLTHLETFSS